ncbi:hypothetical protein F0L68_34775 [Solihabitans fulvus]|uniref:2TM domain-containing protein n=2 Tax=Solihabitans fulvus TaxID=1892852 RepID=A0A5B2WP56_9PSEU|nr:hypothetical protein F0L68_34775 [Solihabitans fulvus]
MAALIAGCEIGFWLILAAGLTARYVLRLRTVGAVLLLCAPVVDLVLLVATVVDLRRGTAANVTHGLAAAYLGFSVAFGHSLVRWADQRFAHRFANGPAPVRPPKYGAAKVRHEWREWGKAVLAWAISCGLILGMIAMVDAPERTHELWPWIIRLSTVVGVWFVGWPLWTTISPPREPANRR